MKPLRILWMLITMMSLIPLNSWSKAEPQEEDRESFDVEESDKDSAKFFFHEHLAKADALVLTQMAKTEESARRKGRKSVGQWKKDRFVFELENEAPIAVMKHEFDGHLKEVIYFHPSSFGVKVLQFYQVPVGSQLVLQYGIDDQGVGLDPSASAYLTIWVGEHRLDRIQVPHEKGLRTKKLDLSLLPFLKRPVAVTFEVTSDNAKASRLSFLAHIQS